MNVVTLLRRGAVLAKPLSASFALALLAVVSAHASPPPGYNLVWADEFNGGVNAQPNSNNWGYDLGGGGWGNGELETYVNDWAHVHIISDSNATDGQALQIQATNTNGYQSVRMKTQGKYSFKYGFIEARIRLPYGQGLWPAFWMLGNNVSDPNVGWPGCGEMDIMENIGKSSWWGTNQASLHTPNHHGGNSLNSQYYLASGSYFKDGYHLFQAQWAPGIVSFYIDNQWYETVTSSDDGGSWPFDNGNMFIILNCAIGGGWPGNPDGTTVWPQNMLVDYVRVYQNPNQPTSVTTNIRALANNLWVCADNYGNNPLIANRTTASTWETFDVIDLGNHNIALRAHANNLYVCADNAGSSPLIANRTAIGGWETYQVVPVPGGIALKAAANGLYVCADNYGNDPLIANRTSAGGWETYQFYLH